VTIGSTKVTIDRENMWMLALPAAMLVGLAALIGPLVIGLAMASIAVGAAVSVGAFAMSFFWLPLIMMFGFGFLVFGGMTFGLATALFLPKMMSLLVAVGGLGVGWFVVNNLLPQAKVTVSGGPGVSGSKGRGSGSDSQDGPVVKAEARSIDEAEEEEVRRMARELRDFDAMMADREERRKVDDWRARRTGSDPDGRGGRGGGYY